MNNQEPNTLAPVITLTASKTADRLAVASFVCGLIGVIFAALFILTGGIIAFAPGYLGYAFYSDAKRRGSTHHLLNSGKIMSIISMSLALFFLLAIIALFAGLSALGSALS